MKYIYFVLRKQTLIVLVLTFFSFLTGVQALFAEAQKGAKSTDSYASSQESQHRDTDFEDDFVDVLSDDEYDIQYPPKWFMGKKNEGAYEQPFSYEYENVKLIPNIKLAPVKIDFSQVDKKAFLKKMLDEYVSEVLNGEVIKEITLKREKGEGKAFIIMNMYGFVPAMTKLYLIHEEHRLVLIIASAPRTQFSKYEQTFDKSVQSFRFK